MQDKIVGAQSQGALYLASKRLHGFMQEKFVGTGHVHQIIRVNHEWLQIVLGAQAVHLRALWLGQFIWSPLARARREHLESVASQTVRALGGVLHPPGRGSMNADPAGSQAGRPSRSREFKNIVHNPSIFRRDVACNVSACANVHAPELCQAAQFGRDVACNASRARIRDVDVASNVSTCFLSEPSASFAVQTGQR